MSDMPDVVTRVFDRLRRSFHRFESSRSSSKHVHRATWNVTVRVEADELDGGFIAEITDLPGCIAHGVTKDEALRNLADVFAGIMAVVLEDQTHEIPVGDGQREHKIALAV